ncbi:hypothetical protein ACLMJK_009369 [Lecanora helva]
MHSIKVMAAAALAFPSIVSAGSCYSGGPGGLDKSFAWHNTKGICDAYMLGYYVKGLQRHGCLKDGGNHWYFTVKLRDDVGDRTIEEDECVSGLQKQIAACDKGGQTTYGHWQYKVDGNHGVCADADYLNEHPELVQAPDSGATPTPASPKIKGRSLDN